MCTLIFNIITVLLSSSLLVSTSSFYLFFIVAKDVLRTDRSYDCFRDPEGPKMKQLEDVLKTYLMYNIDLGYVQGMSDLLAPILVVMDNEIDAFWCFVGYMDLVVSYFIKFC